MTDLERFERRLEARLLAHAGTARRAFDPAAVARDARTVPMARRWPRLGDAFRLRWAAMPAGTVLVLLLLLTLLIVAVYLTGSPAPPDPSRPFLDRTVVGDLSIARCGASGVGLADGGALIVGGWDATGAPVTTAERFDPTTRTFHTVEGTTSAGDGIGLTLLEDGTVLISGGRTSKSEDEAGSCDSVLYTDEFGVDTADAFVYDPATDRITPIAPMTTPRSGHATSHLDDGRVLLAGGNGTGADGSESVLGTAELFDPASRTFRTTGSMLNARGWMAALGAHVEPYATRLSDATVLVSGGVRFNDGSEPIFGEVYDPVGGSFRVPLPDPGVTGERVALPGSSCPAHTECVVWFEPSAASFSAAWDPGDGYHRPASVLAIDQDRAYLVDGRRVTFRDLVRGTESEVRWAPDVFRRWNALAVLRDGSLLLAGGYLAESNDEGGPTTEAELFLPGASSADTGQR